jgi:hypothetical protein
MQSELEALFVLAIAHLLESKRKPFRVTILATW